MSTETLFLTPLSMDAAQEVEADLQRAINDCCIETEDEYGETFLGAYAQSLEDVEASYRRMRTRLDSEVRKRIQQTRTIFTTERAADPRVSPLQVSIFRFLLDRVGEALVLDNEYPFYLSEEYAGRLKRFRGARGFGVAETRRPARRKIEQREAAPGELRAIAVCRVLTLAVEQHRNAEQVQAILKGSSKVAQDYAFLLVSEGSMSDRKAAKRLAIDASIVAAEADALAAKLTELD